MPGSLTTRSRTASRGGETVHMAFGVGHTLGAPDGMTFAARWLAYAHPYRRFAPALADRRARLGADVIRYSFIAEDVHPLSPAGLPAHARHVQRFLSVHDQVNNLFHLRRDHRPAADHRAARAAAFEAWAEIAAA